MPFSSQGSNQTLYRLPLAMKDTNSERGGEFIGISFLAFFPGNFQEKAIPVNFQERRTKGEDNPISLYKSNRLHTHLESL